MLQRVLPATEMQRVCPLCGQHTAILGQYGPFAPWQVCRACSLANPYPVELLVPHPRKPGELYIDRHAPSALLEKRIELEAMVHDAVRGKRVKKWRYAGWLNEARIFNQHRQLHLPYCERCGHAHDNSFDFSGDYHSRCTRCEAEEGVEALWANRLIFGTDDLEVQLDKMYRAFPQWFEAGVLPDYWFKLSIDHQQKARAVNTGIAQKG